MFPPKLSSSSSSPRNIRELGQTATEIALVLPLVLLIIAGMVEVTNLIISQSRLDTAVRRSARFGAQGGIDAGMRIALLQTVTPTLDLDPDRWDVYVIRATVADDGNSFYSDTWSFELIYGTQQVRPLAAVNQADVQADILDNLRQQTGNGLLAANYNIVGVMAFHDVPAILGLDSFIRGLNTVRAFSVMRIVPAPTAMANKGCQAFPIAVEVEARSLADAAAFPDVSSFEYPDEADAVPSLSNFFNEARLPAATSILSAQPGTLFVVDFNGAVGGDTAPEPGTFDFVRWDWAAALTMDDALAASLAWPGNTNAVCDDPDAGDPGWYHPVTGCELDSELQTGDPLRVSTAAIAGAVNSPMKDALEEHVRRGRTLRIALFDDVNPPPRVNGRDRFDPEEMRRVSNFAVVRVLGFNLDAGGDNWLMFEFLGLDSSCGVPELPPSDQVFSDGCTLTRGYWQTHPEAWPADMTALDWATFGGETYTNGELDGILATEPAGDMTYQLIHQLIAAKLNVYWHGAAPSAVAAALDAADQWLQDNPLGSDPGGGARADGEALKTTLDNYNMGVIGPGHCP